MSCSKNEDEATEDLNRLVRECIWDRKQQKLIYQETERLHGMTFFEAVKAFFTPEEKIRRDMIKVQILARRAHYTVLDGVLQEVINAWEFERKYLKEGNVFPNWIGTPSNDEDIIGIRDYLMWSAVKSGWSSNRIHYIEVLYKKSMPK